MNTNERIRYIAKIVAKKDTNIIRNYIGGDLSTGEIVIIRTSISANLDKIEKKRGIKLLVPRENEVLAAAASLNLGISEVVPIDGYSYFRTLLDAGINAISAYRRTMNACRKEV